MVNNTQQIDNKGNLRHLLSIEGLNKEIVTAILNKSETFFEPGTNTLIQNDDLKNATVVNLFYEPSTRTRSTFELAAKRLSANVLNLDIATSAAQKGESLNDTVQNLQAMQIDLLVLRHPTSGAAQLVANCLKEGLPVINAGDGCNAHPSQALLDMFTIRKHRGTFNNLTVAIVGDIKHSRVARSQIHALNLLGAKEVRIIAPETLLPCEPHTLGGLTVYTDLNKGLRDVDVIIMLRLQSERMEKGLVPSGDVYYREYGLKQENLQSAKPDALILHPGPINHNVEIQSELVSSPNSVILDQVTNGMAVRMAIMSILTNKNNQIGQDY